MVVCVCLCGMPACGRQAMGCGVCDTPELGALAWRRRPVCVRVYARVLVPPNMYIHTYDIHTYLLST